MGRSLTRICVIGISIAFAVTACSSGSSKGTASATTGSTPPIEIGATLPLTGTYAFQGQQLADAYRLAVNDINAAGGILHRKLDLKILDDQSSASLAATNTTSLAENYHVKMILGDYASALCIASTNVAQQFNIPTFTAFASDPKMTTRGFSTVFNTFQLLNTVDAAGANAMTTLAHPSKVAIIYVDNAVYSGAVAPTAAILKKANISTDLIKIQDAQPNYSAALLQARQDGDDAIIANMYPADYIVFIKNMATLNYNVKMIYSDGPTITTPSVVKALGGLEESVTGGPNWFPGEQLGTSAELVQRATDIYGSDAAASPEMVFGYAAAQIMAYGITQSHSTDASKVEAAIHSAKTISTVAGPVSFEADGQETAQITPVVQVQHGKYEVIYPNSVKGVQPLEAWVPWSSR